MTPDSSTSSGGGDDRRPRGVRADLSRLLENWNERADEAARVGGNSLEFAAVFGFLRRTNPALLSADDWGERRTMIEDLARAVLRSPEKRHELREQLHIARTRAERELAGFLGEQSARVALQQHGKPSAEDRMHAIQLVERLDAVLLATAFALNQVDDANDEMLRACEGLATRAALSGDHFELIAGWFAAMERSIDSPFLTDRFYWRGEGMRSDDRALLASASWIQTSHARIRAYRMNRAQDAATARTRRILLRQEHALQLADEQASSNSDRWLLVQKTFSDDLRGAASMRLVHALMWSATPRLAAARAPRMSGGETMLEWHAPDGEHVSICSFNPRSGTSELIIEFYNAREELARSLDGQSAVWLGVSITIENGRARFANEALRISASPLDALRRSRALFVGGVLWSAIDQDSSANSGADDADESDGGVS